VYGLDFSSFQQCELPVGYAKVAPLGAGAYGAVLLARDKDGNPCAVKQPHNKESNLPHEH
jgi:hypothetical protein